MVVTASLISLATPVVEMLVNTKAPDSKDIYTKVGNGKVIAVVSLNQDTSTVDWQGIRVEPGGDFESEAGGQRQREP